IIRQSDRYAQVLAQPTSRKLALLVGINQYPTSQRFLRLRGCGNDVELQRQLLIHRFGFNPKNIKILTDKQATRANILEAFEEHLVKQAKPGDVVVFHFSGHGSRVIDPNPLDPKNPLNSTFVPVDDSAAVTAGNVDDIMGRSLFLLMSSLQTDNFTAVLDSCHSGGGTRGNIRIRAARGGLELDIKPSDLELKFQTDLISKLKKSPAEIEEMRKKGVAKGVVIGSARAEEYAADAAFGDFYAGAFTYAMTQYLWQTTAESTFTSGFASFSRGVSNSYPQQPVMEALPEGNKQKPFYFTKQLPNPPAEAVVLDVNGNQARLWLGGLDQQSIGAFGSDSRAIFKVVAGNTRGPVSPVTLTSRQGLIGTATIQGGAQPGALLQEEVRGVPKDLSLRIGLDPSLGGDTNSAIAALKNIPRIEPVPAQSGDVPYSGEVQYILGRITTANRQQFAKEGVQNLPPEGSIGLFSPALEIIPGSFDTSGETVAAAGKRLQAKFKSLLAARLVKLMINPNSSRLKLSVALSPEGKTRDIFGSAFTIRGGAKNPGKPIKDRIPVGTPIQLRITNQENSSLYVNVLVIDAQGQMSVIFPNNWVVGKEDMRVPAGETRLVPNPDEDRFVLRTQEPKGTTEVLVLASRTPMVQGLKALRDIARRGKKQPDSRTLSLSDENDSVNVIDAILSDFDSGTRSSRPGGIVSEERIRTSDTNQLAALSITFEVT
ncbi:MAG: caspase family protein, partial [Nostocaceae cyanobacterium]|nr:caspase family protein [Nostocaceae cyanobacterium]